MIDNIPSNNIDSRSAFRSAIIVVCKTIFLFVLAILTVHFAGRLLWPYETKYYFNRHDSWVRRVQPPPEIVFFGSSTVMYGISPTIVQQELGLPEGAVVNLGFEARSPIISNSVWNDEEQTLSKAKVVVYGLDPWILSEDYYSSDYLVSLHYSLNQVFYQATHPSDLTHLNVAAFGGPAFMYVLQGLHNYNSKVAQPINAIQPDYGGRTLSRHPFNYSSPARGYFEPYPVFGISELYLERLARLKKKVEASGATFLFLLPPKSERWFTSYRDSCKDIDSDLVLKLNRYLGPTRIFGSFDLVPPSLNSEYFQDDLHLGEAGQRFFSQWIAEHLKDALAKQPEMIRPLASY